MADYTHLGASIADEWVAFEKELKRPDLSGVASHAERKAMLNEDYTARFARVVGDVAGITTTDLSIPSTTTPGHTIPARLYRPSAVPFTTPLPLYVHIGGGGFYLGSLASEDTRGRLIARDTGLAVLNVDYRRTPEATFPAQGDDVWDALRWVWSRVGELGVDGERVLVGGVSAGAWLAVEMGVRAGGEEAGSHLQGIIAIVPSTCHPSLFPRALLHDPACSSLEQCAAAPELDLPTLQFFLALLAPDPAAYSHLVRDDAVFRTFPRRVCVQVAGADPLRDEGLLFEEKLRRVGVETRLDVYPGWPHGFMAYPELAMTRRWNEDLYRAIRWILGEEGEGS